MKKMFSLLGIVLLLGLAALIVTFTPQVLDFEPMDDAMLPSASPPEGMSLSVLQTGFMHSQAVFAYRGGSLFRPLDFSMSGILVRHPKGDLLFDTGFGRQVIDHAKTLPPLMKLTSTYSVGTPIADQFQAQQYDPAQLAGIVLTHVHWDHISGIPDLPAVPVWIDAAEQRFIDGDSHMSALARSLQPWPIEHYTFSDTPFLGYPQSHDVWGDGSVVLVPAAGHTPGSIIAFICLPSGRRYALLGDLVWQKEGVQIPAERPWISSMLVDADRRAVREQLRHMAAIHDRFPEYILVPAHDANVAASLPQFPESVR